eukprot:SAG22_NODE_496_length_9797_cov_4.177241_11_plen_256_part_00
MKLTERVLAFADKLAMGPAMMPHQVGVAVPGGITMLTTATEAELWKNGLGMRKLDEDLRNCFGEIDRVGLLEDVVDSKDLLGTDFSHLAPYVEMAYGGGAQYGGWFWMEATAIAEARWVHTRSEEGVRQGATLSCFLCGLSGKRAQLAAEAAERDCAAAALRLWVVGRGRRWGGRWGTAGRHSGSAQGVGAARPAVPAACEVRFTTACPTWSSSCWRGPGSETCSSRTSGGTLARRTRTRSTAGRTSRASIRSRA